MAASPVRGWALHVSRRAGSQSTLLLSCTSWAASLSQHWAMQPARHVTGANQRSGSRAIMAAAPPPGSLLCSSTARILHAALHTPPSLFSSAATSQPYCSSRPVPACVRAAQGHKLRVAAAVSGGVDSAVAAWLLKRTGHEVLGVFMRNWDTREEGEDLDAATQSAALPRSVGGAARSGHQQQQQHAGGALQTEGAAEHMPRAVNVGVTAPSSCSPALTPGQLSCVDAEASAAAAVCGALGIPFHEVDFVRQYWGQVFSEFLSTYASGGTPNPDLSCNRSIKFGELISAAQRLGADAVATGHYAQLAAADGPAPVALLQGADPIKDQSYFLAAVEHQALESALFPVGSLLKSEVRKLAAQAGLQPLMEHKRSSRGICFVGERRSFGAFMAQYVESVPGRFIDVDTGRPLGSCQDILAFTPGQRARIPGSSKAPWYVAGKDMHSNSLLLAQGHDHPALLTRTALLGQPSWLTGEAPPQLRPGSMSSSTQTATAAPSSQESDQTTSSQASGSSAAPGATAADAQCGPPLEGSTGNNTGNNTGWALRLRWDRALRCLAKVSYRQPRMEPCWLVEGQWERVGAGELRGCASDWGGSSSRMHGCPSDWGNSSSSTSSTHGCASDWGDRCSSSSSSKQEAEKKSKEEAGSAGSGSPGAALPRTILPSRLHSLPGAVQGGVQLAVVFDVPLRALAPQQAVVVYEPVTWAGSTCMVVGQSGGGSKIEEEGCLLGGRAEGRQGEAGRGVHRCLGSAPLLVPGQTLLEEVERCEGLTTEGD